MGIFLMKMKKQRPNKWRTLGKRRLEQALLHSVWHYYFSNVDGFANQCFFYVLTAAMRLKGRVDGVPCWRQRWVQSGPKSGHTSAFQISHSSVLAKGVQYCQVFSMASASPFLVFFFSCWDQPFWQHENRDTVRAGICFLAWLSPFSLYAQRRWWIISPVTLYFWSRAATDATVWKSE